MSYVKPANLEAREHYDYFCYIYYRVPKSGAALWSDLQT